MVFKVPPQFFLYRLHKQINLLNSVDKVFLQKKTKLLIYFRLNWRSNPAWHKGFLTCGFPRALTKPEVGEMMHVTFFHQSTKNRLMEEYLIYFHFRLMHHRIVPRLAIPASWWDWHVPEIGRNCSGWSSFQFCVVSNPMSLFPTKIVLPSCSVATCPSSIFSQNWKFPKFLYTPPRFVEAAYFASRSSI